MSRARKPVQDGGPDERKVVLRAAGGVAVASPLSSRAGDPPAAPGLGTTGAANTFPERWEAGVTARVLELQGVGVRARTGTRDEASIDLYWLPLGAGGRSVRLNGRVFEAVMARVERRRPLDLYHSALEVRVPEGRFVIEMTPIPDAEGAARGVVGEGPVGSRRIARFRVFRYELRRWRDGLIPDADEAVASPQRLSDDRDQAHRLLDLVASVPRPVWGRDELGAGEMWNSNSVVSWLLARSGLPTDRIRPAGGRAPGWDAGLVLATRDLSSPPRGLAADQRAARAVNAPARQTHR